MKIAISFMLLFTLALGQDGDAEKKFTTTCKFNVEEIQPKEVPKSTTDKSPD